MHARKIAFATQVSGQIGREFIGGDDGYAGFSVRIGREGQRCGYGGASNQLSSTLYSNRVFECAGESLGESQKLMFKSLFLFQIFEI